MTLRSAILALLLCAAHAQARTLYVSLTGSHDTNAPAFSTWSTAATNFADAVLAAENGDTVRIAPGTYVYNRSGLLVGKSDLNIIGGRGTLFDADRTILRNQNYNRLHNSTNCTISGVTFWPLSGGNVTDAYDYRMAKSLTFDSCIIRGSSSLRAFILTAGAGSTARNCIIAGNAGVGVQAGGADTTIHSCIYTENGGANFQQSPGGTPNMLNNLDSLEGIAEGSGGSYSNFSWAGVSAYIPRLGSLARKNGQPYAGIETASDGAGGPALVTSRPFLGRDATTNLNHGAAIGGVTSASDSPFAGEQSAAFDGASGVIGVGNNINAYLTNSPVITLELWVKNDTLLNTRCAAIIQADTGAGLGLFLLSGAIQIAARSRQADSAQWASLGAQPTNEWIHIAAVSDYANDKIYAYANGACVVTQSATFGSSVYAGVVPSARSSCIGANEVGGTQLWDGEISDLRIWNVARTPEQIAAAYTNRLTGTEEGLVGYWPLKDPAISPIDTGPFNLDNPALHPTYMEAF